MNWIECVTASMFRCKRPTRPQRLGATYSAEAAGTAEAAAASSEAPRPTDERGTPRLVARVRTSAKDAGRPTRDRRTLGSTRRLLRRLCPPTTEVRYARQRSAVFDRRRLCGAFLAVAALATLIPQSENVGTVHAVTALKWYAACMVSGARRSWGRSDCRPCRSRPHHAVAGPSWGRPTSIRRRVNISFENGTWLRKKTELPSNYLVTFPPTCSREAERDDVGRAPAHNEGAFREGTPPHQIRRPTGDRLRRS